MKLRRLLVVPAALLMGLSTMSVSGLSANADNYNQNGNRPIAISKSKSSGGRVIITHHPGKRVTVKKVGSHRHHKHYKKVTKKAKKHGLVNASLSDTPKNTRTYGYGTDTTGGIKASSHPVIVRSVSALRSALRKANGKPVTIVVKGTLDGNKQGRKEMTTKQYAKGTGYSFSKYKKAYNPKTYGKKEPKGTQANDLKKAATNQKRNTEVKLPANVSLVGAPHARLRNLNLVLSQGNDIVRNLNIQAPSDDFPQWDPKDGASGNWNSQYDAISIKGGHNYWIDHNTITDGSRTDSKPSKATFNRQYQHHDGLTDITNGANSITVSNNKYMNHDKTMLIGNSDKRTSDRGKLKTTIKNNYFHNTVQRNPRVRYGTVNVIGNYFSNDNNQPYPYGYILGYGKDAKLYANHNRLATESPKAVKDFVAGNQGKSITGRNVIINGRTYNIRGKGKHVKMTVAKHRGKAPKINAYRKNGAKLTFGKHYNNQPSKDGSIAADTNENSNTNPGGKTKSHHTSEHGNNVNTNSNSNNGDNGNNSESSQSSTSGNGEDVQYMNLNGHHSNGKHIHAKQVMEM